MVSKNISNTTTLPPVTPSTPAAEPGPNWPAARVEWGAVWEIHWIGLGIAFALIAVHSLFALVIADKSKAFTRRLLFYAVNTLLLVLGTVRAVYLWIDPYGSTQNGVQVTLWVNRVLFGVAFPCLTSAFCLIHVAFLEVSKIKLGSKKLHSIPFVSAIIFLHFVIVFVSEIIVAFEADKKELLIVCQSFFIIWGFLNSFAFLYSGGKIIHKSNEAKKQLTQINTTTETKNEARKDATSKVAKVMMITAFLSMACCALQIYFIVGVYGSYSTVVNPAPWSWYAFQTGFRLVEIAMGWTLAYTVVQPSEYGKSVLFKSCCRKTGLKEHCDMSRQGTVNESVAPSP